MSTIRDSIETSFSATAFAEQNLAFEARQLLRELRPETARQPIATKQVEKRPRPTLHAK